MGSATTLLIVGVLVIGGFYLYKKGLIPGFKSAGSGGYGVADYQRDLMKLQHACPGCETDPTSSACQQCLTAAG